MRTSPRSRTALAVLAACAMIALAVVPTGQAQTQQNARLEITGVTVPTTPVKPEIESPSFQVKMIYKLPNQALTLPGAINNQVPITITHTCESGVVITGPSVKLVTVDAGSTTTDFPVDASFQLTIPRTAPGLRAIPCTVRAQADALQGQSVGPSTEVPLQYQVTADYYGLSQVKIAQKLKNAGPQKNVPFELEITNFGNARTLYTFSLGNAPDKGRWEEILPEDLLLDSLNSGQGTNVNTAIFQVSTTYKNGWNNEIAAYQLLIDQVAADDPGREGLPMTANMLVRVRGVYIPTLEPLIMVGAVVSMALVARMRRDEE